MFFIDANEGKTAALKKTIKKMKKLFFPLLAVFAMALTGCSDDEPTMNKIIPEDAFPDVNFREYVLDQFDIDADGLISENEAARVTKIRVAGSEIESLEGIQYFLNLDTLYCGYNKLTSLDVSKNTELTYLDCGSNQLTALDVSKNTKLTAFGCGYNQLTALDVSKNTELTELYCQCNLLTALDVSKNTELTYLACHNNQLTALDVSKNTKLTALRCYSNELTELDVSKNTELIGLACNSNQLTALDVSKTNLGNSNRWLYPLGCSDMSTLKTLTLKTGWSIKGITKNRSTDYIPEHTEIIFAD